MMVVQITQKTYLGEEDFNRLNPNPSTIQKETQSNRDPLQNPSDNLPKATQSNSDILVNSGKSLNQIVLENNIPNKPLEDTAATNRDLGSLATESVLGTTADVNALPSEINSKTAL